MNFSRIVCLPDLLRGTRIFPEGFFDLVREPIRQGCGLDIGFPPGAKPLHGLMPGFELARFRELAGSRPLGTAADMQARWAATYHRVPDAAISYLFEHLPEDYLILSFEMPPWLEQVCVERAQPFIDARVSPLRFGRDLYLALRCSDAGLRRRIDAQAVADEELRMEAALLAANVRTHRLLMEETQRHRFSDLDGCLLYVGQAPYDASLLSPGGGSLRCDDFADRLRQLSQGRRLLYKGHPFAPWFVDEERAALRRITAQTAAACPLNAYQILSSQDDLELVGISSGLLQEARWFDKTAHMLFQPFVPLAISNEDAADAYRQVHFQAVLAPAFWHQLLTPERPAPRLAALPALVRNFARETFDHWWDYSKVMSWERTLPHETFMRSGGATLRQRIESLEQQVAQLYRSSTTKSAPVPTVSPDAHRWNNLDARHLSEQTDPAAAADLFKRSVRMVEIEVFSYCNRRCWFCPNASVDRISANHFMPEEMYTSILRQLASIDYDGMLTYSRYNEPLADKIILERIAEARRLVPNAVLHTNTNGDYLDNEYLKQLYEAGLRSLNIQIYLKNNERYDHAKIKAAAKKILRRIDLPHTPVRDTPGEWYELRLHHRDMSIRMYGRNFDTNGTSRGGQVPIHIKHERTSPCLMPFWAMYVDHDGSTVPCCNFRSDVPAHKDYVIGNLQSQPDLFLQYAGRFAASFRASLIKEGVKGGLCHNCHYAQEEPTPAQAAQLARLLDQSGGAATPA